MSTELKSKIGFIGIGNMGWPMASCIHEAGFDLCVFDMDAQRAEDFAKEKGASAGSLKDLAQADIIVLMLPNGFIVHDVLVNAEDGAFINNAKPGTIVVDMSSSAPTGTQELGKVLAEKGILLVDAPVSGAVPRATLGTLTLMIGSDDKASIEKVRPLLNTMGDRLFETGALGTGHAVKALNNYIGATSFAATSEALLIAKRFGLDQKTLIDILNVSTGKTFISEVVMQEHVLDEKYATGFALGLLAKDVGIAGDLATAVNLDAPVLQMVRERWDLAKDTVGATADNTEALKAWNKDLV